RRAPYECVRQYGATERHEQIKRRQHKDFAGDADEIEQECGYAVERMSLTEEGKTLMAHRKQRAGHAGHDEKPHPEEEQICERDEKRHDELAAPHATAMATHHSHR